MSKQDDGGPAFPAKVSINRETGKLIPHQFGSDDFCTEGMSLRDHFAGLALQGALAYPNTTIADVKASEYASLAYRLADAMLEARRA